MKRDLVENALQEISNAHIHEAAVIKKKRVLPWISAVAALLVVAICLHLVSSPLTIKAQAVAVADEPRVTTRPRISDYSDTDQWREADAQWTSQRDARDQAASDAMAQMEGFLLESCRTFLGDPNSNTLYSPINAYIGLAMAAEITGGSTRQQLLDILGAPDQQTLRSQVSALWEKVYQDNGKEICTLANSLWLDRSLSYRQEPMDTLAHDYYTSVFREDLASEQTRKDIRTWLNQNTGGFLKDAVDSVQLPEEAVLALYTTIYFRSQWQDEFVASQNTDAPFHGTGGDTTATYMNKTRYQTHYYWGDSFCAVALQLKNGSSMWFILPDEGKTPADVLESGEYLQMITADYEQWAAKKYMLVNLSIPKFDVRSTSDLRYGLENMGITDLFDPAKADFSPSFDGAAFMTAANQSVRVAIDEDGVTAAAYIELPAAGAAMPPEEIIDFVLDRPFLFVITDGQIPLFAGVINQI